MKLFFAVILAASASYAAASCINGCSGHGFCGAFDKCTCYGNWAGTDCSGRVCPQTKAWVDTAILTNDAHNYATCGNKGACDGKSGQCDCWEPFEGKGCRRMACPNGCSGHGTCEYQEELATRQACPWDASAQGFKTNCVHASIGGYSSAGAVSYTGWDAKKIQGCVCDPGWEGTDCSGRICPSGNDPLRTRNADESAVQVKARFDVKIGAGGGTYVATAEGAGSQLGGVGGASFVLAFTDTYNEKWYTRPIRINSDPAGTNEMQGTLEGAGVRAELASNVYKALMDLPNAAITGESIDPITGVTDTAGALTVTVENGSHSSVAANNGVDIRITFNSPHNSGPLTNKLECHIAGCLEEGGSGTASPGGCSPKYNGLTLATTGHATNVCSVVVGVAGTTNYDTCSGRGSCDGGSGLCACHEGFTDEDCSMQTVLV